MSSPMTLQPDWIAAPLTLAVPPSLIVVAPAASEFFDELAEEV